MKNVPVNVNCDENRLQQVLTNLVGNAMKFTDEGHVKVKASAKPSNQNTLTVDFSVSDTGIGIEPSKQKAIFKAFSQADSEISLQFGGTGLGLAITQSIVTLMKGKILLESQPGMGTTFSVHLPLGISTIDESLDLATQKNLDGITVLVVDDNDVNVMVLENLLKRWNAKVKNGFER